jgi:hypothetical protein
MHFWNQLCHFLICGQYDIILIICTYPQISLDKSCQRGRGGGSCSTHGTGKKYVKNLVESPKERNHSVNRRVDGRLRSEWILGRLGGVWIVFSCLRREPVAGCFEGGDESSGSEATELITWLK